MKEAADFCADLISDGSWQAVVADRIAGYAETTWERLSRDHRQRNCDALARMARAILAAKDQVHKLAGDAIGKLASTAGVSGAPLDFTKELARNIPIQPLDAKMTATARGIQIAGIVLCLMDGRRLTRCQCFIDLAQAEAKERVRQILEAALDNWIRLAEFGPTASVATHPAGS